MKTKLMWSLSDKELTINTDINVYLELLSEIDLADAIDMDTDIKELMLQLTDTLSTQLTQIKKKYFVNA